MFEGLRINWTLFNTVPNEIGSGPNAIIVVGADGTPEWSYNSVTSQEMSDISYYDAMGRMVVRDMGES